MSINDHLITGAAVTACAVAGSLASEPDGRWYRGLAKPSFNPPNAVFPIAWTSLYADIAVTQGRVLSRLEGDARTRHLGALGRNLLLNAGWSATFFRAHNLPLATGWAAVLAADSALLVRRTAGVDRAAGWALAPYAAWTGFATVLAGALWQRNR